MPHHNTTQHSRQHGHHGTTQHSRQHGHHGTAHHSRHHGHHHSHNLLGWTLRPSRPSYRPGFWGGVAVGSTVSRNNVDYNTSCNSSLSTVGVSLMLGAALCAVAGALTGPFALAAALMITASILAIAGAATLVGSLVYGESSSPRP